MSLSGYENTVKLDSKNPQHNEMYKRIEMSFAYQILLLMQKYDCKWSDIKRIDKDFYHTIEEHKHLHSFTINSTLIIKDIELKDTIWQRIKRIFK